MARPHKQGLDYFPHDVDASNDEKIEAMETQFGPAGYAFYFKLAERIYRAGGELVVADDVTKETLAKKCLCSREDFDRMLASALHLELFDANIFETRFLLTSSGIKKRCKSVFQERRRDAKSKKEKRLGDGIVRQENAPKTPRLPPDSFRESKEKESKEKERRRRVKSVLAHVDPAHLIPARPDPENLKATKDLLKRFTPPALEEICAYCHERGNKVDPERFRDWYEAKGWMVGKNKMKDWRAAVRTWEKGESDGSHRKDSRRFETRGEKNARQLRRNLGLDEAQEADSKDDRVVLPLSAPGAAAIGSAGSGG